MTAFSPRVGATLSAVIAAIAFGLFWGSQAADPAEHRSAIKTVEQIRQLAAEWTTEAAKVRSDPLADYDALAAFIPRVEELTADLLATVGRIEDAPDRLLNDVSAYVSAIDAKEERIERFKTANSVVRNSARYLPLAAADIVQNEAAGTALKRDVSRVANDVSDFLAVPTDAAKGRLSAVVARLETPTVAHPEAVADSISGFVSHATILLEYQGPALEMFEQATSNDISDLSNALIRDIGTEAGLREGRVDWFNGALLVAAVGLLALWVAVALAKSRTAAGVLDAKGAMAVPSRAVVQRASPPAARAAPSEATEPESDTDRTALLATRTKQSASVKKTLITHQIVAEAISQRIDDASRTIADRAGQPPFDNGAAEDVRRSAEKISELANRLASVSRSHDSAYALLDMADCVGEALLASGALELATVTTEGSVPEVFGSRVEVCLMLEKVFENSVQAIAAKGSKANEEGAIEVTVATGERGATVTIMDNGVGMSPEARKLMYEPFYTSHPDRSGVGLTATKHLVGKYAGNLSVISHEGGGTVTRIELPGMSR